MNWLAVILAIILIIIVLLIPVNWVWKIVGILLIIILAGAAWAVVRGFANSVAPPNLMAGGYASQVRSGRM